MDDICGDVGKSSWPELLGVHESVAVETIERENTSVRVDVMPPGMMGTTDFNCRRVRVWVDANGIVIQVPDMGKSSWPELVGAVGELAVVTILRENPLVDSVFTILVGTIVTQEIDCSRVRVWVDTDGIVAEVPMIG